MQETTFSGEEANEVLSAINGGVTSLQVRKAIVNNDKPWLLGSSDQVALIYKLEKRFPLLEDTGCNVFIGAATGSNKVYIVDSDYEGSKIEKERLLPVVTANELKSGSIVWREKYLINTFIPPLLSSKHHGSQLKTVNIVRCHGKPVLKRSWLH